MNVLKCIWNSMVRHENKLGDFFELQGYALLDPRWNLIQVCGIVFSYNIVCRGKERYVEEERSGCISKCCFVLKKLSWEETVHLSKCIYTTTYGGEYSVRVLFQKFISVTEVFSLLGFLPIGLLLTYPRCQGIQNYVSRWGVFSIQFIRIVFESPQMKVTKLLIDLSNICNSQMQLDIHYRVLRPFTSVKINCPFCYPCIAPVHVSFLVSHCTKARIIQSVFLGLGFSFSTLLLSKGQLLV